MSRLVLVTGAASGLGRATAERLAHEGYRIILTDLAGDAVATLRTTLHGDGHDSLALDVTDEAAVGEAFDRIEVRHGPIDALCHFAGILNASGRFGRMSLEDISVAEWDRVFAVNARGSFLCTREMARCRRERPVSHGRIVLCSSVAGQSGGLQAGAAYSASKGAVAAFMKVAARELAPLAITVNAIAPGAIDTPMMRLSVPEAEREQGYRSVSAIPLGRVGAPPEIAAAASFLVSEDAAYVTGATIDVNGGVLMR